MNEEVFAVVNKLNRHAKVRQHKRREKKQYGIWFDGHSTNLKLTEAKCRREHKCRYGLCRYVERNGGYAYWRKLYLSGKRRYAKECTNRVIRARYRDMLNVIPEENLDEVPALRCSDYERQFDFEYSIW